MISGFLRKKDNTILPNFNDRRLQKRVKTLEKQRRVFKKDNKHAKEASVCDEIAMQCFDQGFFPEAVSFWKEALRIYQDLNDRVSMAEIFTKIGNTCRKQRNHREAVRYFQKARIIDTEFDQGENLITSLHNLGSTWLETGEYEHADPVFTEALQIARKLEHKEWEAYTLYRLGYTKNRLFYYIDAFQYYEQSLTLADSLNISNMITQGLIGMGDLYVNTGNYDQALQCYGQAVVNASKDKKSILYAESLTRLAEFKLHVGCLDEAREIAREVDEILPSDVTLSTRIELDLIRAEIYNTRGMKENAKILIERVLSLSESMTSSRGFIRAYILLAAMEVDSEKYSDALAIMKRITVKIPRPADVSVEIEQISLLSKIHLCMNQLQHSLEHAEKAVQIAEKSRIPRYLWQANYDLGRVYNVLQKYQQAKAAYEAADKVLREIGSSLEEPLRRKFIEQRERQMFYQHYILLLRKLNHKEEALRVLENVNSSALQRRVGHLFED